MKKLKKHKRTKLGFCLLFCCGLQFAVLIGGCSRQPTQPKLSRDGQPLQSVTLMLNWYPEAEHGGFYAADIHGIFEEYGLDVEIRPGGPNAPVAQELVTGRVQFAIGNADDVLLFRQQKAPIVSVMAPIQNTPRCVMVRADSEISDLSSLSGLTLQANTGRPFLDFMQSKGLLEGVRVVAYSGSVANFVADKNTAIQAYSFSEPYLAEQEGIKTRCLMLSDIGFNPYASCLITHELMIQDRPELVQKMVSACRRGWQRYLEDADSTNRRILELNEHGMTMKALEYGATAIRDLCLPKDLSPEEVGSMSVDRWQMLYDQFADMGLLDRSSFEPNDVFTTKFLSQVEGSSL